MRAVRTDSDYAHSISRNGTIENEPNRVYEQIAIATNARERCVRNRTTPR